MGETMTKTEINNLSEGIAEYKGCKALWIAVVLQAIRDSKTAVLNSSSRHFEKAIKIEMLYFKSRGFEYVCNLAGVQFDLKDIENGLRRLCGRGI